MSVQAKVEKTVGGQSKGLFLYTFISLFDTYANIVSYPYCIYMTENR